MRDRINRQSPVPIYHQIAEALRNVIAVGDLPAVDLDRVRNPSPALHGALALVALLAATVLAVYKPRGMTRYGWRRQQERQDGAVGAR